MLLTMKRGNSVYSAAFRYLVLFRVNSWLDFPGGEKAIHEFTRIRASKRKSRVSFSRFTRVITQGANALRVIAVGVESSATALGIIALAIRKIATAISVNAIAIGLNAIAISLNANAIVAIARANKLGALAISASAGAISMGAVSSGASLFAFL